jgi:hypothetical protein
MNIGDKVRLKPHGGADIFDLVLGGRSATVQSIERDLQGREYFAVTVDQDAGRSSGRSKSSGHRFFFRPDEVEPLSKKESGHA